jgi:hypothetical protein
VIWIWVKLAKGAVIRDLQRAGGWWLVAGGCGWWLWLVWLG